MNKFDRQKSSSRQDSLSSGPWLWPLLLLFVLVVLGGLITYRPRQKQNTRPTATTNSEKQTAGAGFSRTEHAYRSPRRGSAETGLTTTAEEIVAAKLAKFAQSRRKLVHRLAKHFNVAVPTEVERFFDAVEGGRWEEIDAAHAALLEPGQGLNQPNSAELHKIWRGIQETWGIAREAHDWPAQRLLDYGESVLGSLRPGMVYVGGTDPGCFIPTFLNETAEGEHHVTLTQNALADDTYLEYLNYLYGDQLTTLTQNDSQQAFQQYVADAQKRLEHDQQFPDQPKQVRPGEDIHMKDNRIEVSGQVAVMAINERLFQMLMDKNPDSSFAIEQSFPFASTYSNATPLGPIMELRVQDQQNTLSADRAGQSVDYWRATAQELLSDSDSANSSSVRMAYAKMACEQAALFQNRNYNAEAEDTFRVALEIAPSSPEAVFRYVNLLAAQNRIVDGIPVVEAALQAAPDSNQFRALLDQLKTMKKN